ncbi:hypothetical protein BKA70DRAFT_1327101, partial [Coprinopsis sp. MPI-PUGE-AT-0042]
AHPGRSPLREAEEQTLNIEHESALLIAELQLQDALPLSVNSRGKATVDAPEADQEIALRLQAERLSGWKETHRDAAIAESIDHALEWDAEITEEYRMMGETAAADRRVAQPLHQISNVPQPSTAQETVGENGNLGSVFMKILTQLSASKPAAIGWQPDSSQQASINKLISTAAQTIAGPSVDRFRSVP